MALDTQVQPVHFKKERMVPVKMSGTSLCLEDTPNSRTRKIPEVIETQCLISHDKSNKVKLDNFLQQRMKSKKPVEPTTYHQLLHS